MTFADGLNPFFVRESVRTGWERDNISIMLDSLNPFFVRESVRTIRSNDMSNVYTMVLIPSSSGRAFEPEDDVDGDVAVTRLNPFFVRESVRTSQRQA